MLAENVCVCVHVHISNLFVNKLVLVDLRQIARYFTLTTQLSLFSEYLDPSVGYLDQTVD